MAEERAYTNDGKSYENVQDMWNRHVGCDGGKRWYQDAIEYWEKVDASLDGVLGGFGRVSDEDTAESKIFVRDVLSKHLECAKSEGRITVALDCGAGIGRVTEKLLLDVFDRVDLLEPLGHFLEKAKEQMKKVGACGDKSERKDGHKVSNFFQVGMQDFVPEEGRYDCVWIQWCLGHLDDEACVKFLQRCCKGLKEGGIIVVKENISSDGLIVDREDSSVTRTHRHWLCLFKRGNLGLLKVRDQKRFPKELFAVKMYALTPR